MKPMKIVVDYVIGDKETFEAESFRFMDIEGWVVITLKNSPNAEEIIINKDSIKQITNSFRN